MQLKRLYIVAFVFLFIAILLAGFSDTMSNKNRYPETFMRELKAKVQVAQNQFEFLQDVENNVEKIVTTANNNGIILLRYKNDSLLFWSTNAVPLDEKYPEATFRPRIAKIFNSYYYVVQQVDGDYRNVALITLKYSYAYENDFLRSGFHPDFKLPAEARIGFSEVTGYPVYDTDASYLFSIRVASAAGSTPQLILATLFFFLSIALLGFALFQQLIRIWDRNNSRWVVWISIFILIFLRVGQLVLEWQTSVFLLFDPYVYADSVLAPSLGDLLLNSLVFFFVAVLLSHMLKEVGALSSSNRILKLAVVAGLNLGCLLFYVYAQHVSFSLVFNSNIAFGLNTTHKISPESLIGYLVIGLNYMAIYLVGVQIIRYLLKHFEWYFLIQVFVICSALVFGVASLHDGIRFVPVVFYMLFIGLVTWLVYRRIDISQYSYRVLFTFLFSTYLFVHISMMEAEKEKVVRSSLALSLSNEHDPVAEFLFEQLSEQIEADTIIQEAINSLPLDMYALSDYIKGRYFTGFWNKYDLQITVCSPSDSVLLETPEYYWFHCYGFFDAIVEEIGYSLPDTRFYYLDNLVGRISYLGRFPYYLEPDSMEMSLFVELDAKLTTEFLGYPELLLDERLHEERLIENYAYAKYYRGGLVSKHGDFSYSLTSELFGQNDAEYSEVEVDKYHHLLYKPDVDSLIVISRPKLNFLDYLIGFSYIFLFYFLFLLVLVALKKTYANEWHIMSNLRTRIQFSILGVLLVSLVLIAGSTIWLNSRNYKESQYDLLQEKIQSVLIELSHKLANEDTLSPYWHTSKYQNLNQLLIKFSEVFYTDINLYTPDGSLLATSRYEIFELGLQGEKMDPMAYHRLSKQYRAQFIHSENVGALQYLSAYIPFYNNSGELLAYLNLPYFTKQSEYQADLSAALITIVNIYVILILITILLTILISEQITRPLAVLQMRFRNLRIGDKYEQIFYKRNDEIGQLVAEYNHMVLELERSVNLLARSERESAWREMAKQIAHEIKNPLTPMRLNVQQLNRLWMDKPDEFGDYLNKVSVTLIEQIDNLSTIATSFSNFAKMPIAKFEELNLVSVVQNVCQLFENEPKFELHTQMPSKPVMLKADKEQLSRVFINLIKNGAQSIPDGRRGKIELSVEVLGSEALIKISDNGNGIPEDVQSKLFTPNFTTKTSGMGLGLAIVRNIIEQLQGAISFETELNQGTVFHVRLPLS